MKKKQMISTMECLYLGSFIVALDLMNIREKRFFFI